MNARRLAATETNMAYRTADHERWQRMDFVVGIEIHLSGNHTCLGRDGKPHRFADICDELQGRYPKDFKFTGWHPHCRCYATTILKTDKELAEDTKRILRGERPEEGSENTVEDVPEGFKGWVEKNQERIDRARERGTLPYYIRDNQRYTEEGLRRSKGSEANSNVYNAIKGDDVIWVRSDRKSKKGPCDEFKRLKIKYCLACYHKNISGEICFVYRNDKWHRSKGYECNSHNSRAQEDMANNSHPQAIDLGLPSGTKWASCNVGATKPEEFGGYFAWGETEEKTSYKWRTYIPLLGDEGNCKYLESDIAGTEYDVAHVRWGGNWRMPTQKQFMELLKHCNHEWIPQNGVYGRKFTSKINGNSIFLPAAGFRGDSNLNDVSKGYYWSSIPYSPKGNSFFQSDSDMAGAEFLNFNSDDAIAMGCKYLRDGLTVRPVSR